MISQMRDQITDKIKKFSIELGFDLIKIIPAHAKPSEKRRLKKWLSLGKNADMEWMKNNSDLRADPDKILPGAKSIICLATNYFNSVEPRLHEDSVKIARYAWSKNYHKIIEKRLKYFEEFIKKLAPKAKIKRYVDTGPFLERYFASQAGLGFIGKNNCLITREFGSFVFLAEIITDLALSPDETFRRFASQSSRSSSISPSTSAAACFSSTSLPPSPSCGTCTRCIDACPTGALKPHNLDARKCISYLTIESKKPFPKSIRAKIKPWIFGCDACQNACPHNVRATPTKNPDFALAAPLRTLTLSQLRTIKTEDEFKNLLAGTSLIRAKFKGMKRNIK
ncbi:MAG: hypothetical protein US89_C0006G0070 [Candidatus Peregrinibacteria bacterium GW2011_GWF2_38_29]|nr:MAG: hypothetical protein US89_C0006G0070 [Candidatus Peregrinibacteria bacterium GW2011_GWF2_38_29]HBB03261.1 hypothetical protein [Candidatus Peregrinibacteria bacterium]